MPFLKTLISNSFYPHIFEKFNLCKIYKLNYQINIYNYIPKFLNAAICKHVLCNLPKTTNGGFAHPEMATAVIKIYIV